MAPRSTKGADLKSVRKRIADKHKVLNAEENKTEELKKKRKAQQAKLKELIEADKEKIDGTPESTAHEDTTKQYQGLLDRKKLFDDGQARLAQEFQAIFEPLREMYSGMLHSYAVRSKDYDTFEEKFGKSTHRPNWKHHPDFEDVAKGDGESGSDDDEDEATEDGDGV